MTAQTPTLDQGPGGPILLITSTANPFTKYFAEILRAEGFNEFSSADISTITSSTLAPFDVAILGDIPLTAAQVTTLTNWVNGGGNLIAMRPDKQLYGLLGVTDTLTPISDAYLLIDTTGPPGRGLVSETIQFHGTGDKVTLNGATAIATFYSTVTNPTSNPAVTQRSVVNGRAAAFYYDLARSVVYTRQGNPAFNMDERDGIPPIRSDDLYFGNKAGDPKPDWVNLNKVQIPQADEQQRLLANLILQMTLSKKPLPRFWYFPRGSKAVVVLTGDDHANNGTAPRFDHYMALSTPGCNVANWECIRSTSYIYSNTPLTAASAAFYVSQGFEISIHVDSKGPTGVGGCTDFTPTSLANDYLNQINDWKAKYTPSIPAPSTHRMHCLVWSDYSSQPTVELSRGIRFDTSYYYWPPFWMGAPATRAGMFTGSGMPMRYADLAGNMIDVYQATTQMTDESGQDYPGTADILLNNTQSLDLLLDNAVGNRGYYGAFTVNMHNDQPTSADADKIITSAQTRQVPIVSSKQMLDWLDGRNGSLFGSLVWSGASSGTLTFTITAASGANGLQTMLPAISSAGRLLSLTRNGVAVAITPKIIKGTEYAFFSALSGNYQANYAPDVTPPVITNVNAAPTATTAVITWTTDKLSNSHVDFGTNAAALQAGPTDSALVTSHTVTLTGLTPSTQYFYRVSSTDLSNNTATFPVPPGTLAFTTNAPPAPTTCLTDTTVADFSAGTGTNSYIGQTLNTADGEVILTPLGLAEEFSGSALSQAWTSGPWTAAEGGPSTCNPPTVTTGCGTVTVANGALTVDGARATTTTSFAAGRSLEFVATFTGQPFQHVGFVADFAFNPPWAIFSTTGGGQVFARTANNGTFVDTPLGSTFLNSPHRYRIDWTATNAVFSIDGLALVSHAFATTTSMRPVASDFRAGSDANDPIGKVTIEWMHMSPYAPAGTFTSRVFDAGTTATWSTLSWTAVVPTGANLALFVRTGNTATPDASWSAFTPITNGGSINQTGRFAQYQAQFSATDTTQTPVLKDVTICFTAAPPPPHTTTTAVSCAPPSVPVNGSTTCTATVTDTNATPTTPTGVVSFTSNGTGSFAPAASCTLGGSGSSATCSVTYTPTAIGTGTHAITASYGGDSTHATSSGSTNVTVTARTTSTTVSCVPSSVAVNQATSCTATVTDTSGAGATTPGGTVSFTSNGTGSFTPAASCTLNASGQCSVTYTPTAIGTGTHTITASYGGDSAHATSNGSTNVTVTARTTSTTVSCVPSSVAVNQGTSCTATVTDTSGAGATMPGGTVSFTSNGTGSFTPTASCTLNASGQCSVTYTPTTIGTGTHTIAASYGGDSTHATSNGSTNVTVTARTTSTTVSCVPSSVALNQATSCTATVTDTSGTGATTPGGTVSFTSNGTGSFTPAAGCTLNASGQCSVTYTPTAIGTGTHTITASYGGDGAHATSNGSTNVTVTARTTSTTVSCAPASVPVNGSTSCTATVTDTSGAGATTPGGTVSFTSNGTGSFTPAASCTLNVSGQCSVTYTPTAIGTGTHTITASYGGDSTHTSSNGSTNVTVTVRTTSTSLSCVPSNVQVSQPTTCTATVADSSGSGAITPQGTVAFASNGSGTFSSSTCTLDMTGKCSVTYTPSAVGTGTHTITGSYGGDAVHTGSSGSTNVTVTPPAAGEVEGGGKITVPGGTASFGFEVERKIAGGSIKGELHYRNRPRQMTVRATVIRQFTIVGNTATFSGDCMRKIDGGPWTACTFSVTAQDNGDPGKNRDRFTITVNNDPPEGTAPIIAGNIEIERGS